MISATAIITPATAIAAAPAVDKTNSAAADAAGGGGVRVGVGVTPTTATTSSSSSRRIVRLSSGLQFSDARIGSGPFVQKQQRKQEASNDDNTNTNNNSDVVLMHLKALRRDDSILFDTREEGLPILFQLGSIQEELYYFNSNSISKGRITLGVQDAILAPGIVVVPSELAYGTNGISRYDAYKLNLKQPVAKNEILRYEIELFRCNDNDNNISNDIAKNKNSNNSSSSSSTTDATTTGTTAADGGGGNDVNGDDDDGITTPSFTARACCLEDFYPCQTPSSS
jgi:hypothetical protein